MQVGDRISRIGGEAVDGIVARVVVDMGPNAGTVLDVRIGETSRLVCAEACEACPLIESIGRDGATMPCADGADISFGEN